KNIVHVLLNPEIYSPNAGRNQQKEVISNLKQIRRKRGIIIQEEENDAAQSKLFGCLPICGSANNTAVSIPSSSSSPSSVPPPLLTISSNQVAPAPPSPSASPRDSHNNNT